MNAIRLSITLLFSILLGSTRAWAISFDLDSIASWGKFPAFCIKTYRWGDSFFNDFDTTYVNPTGYRMNVKLKTDNWIDSYTFRMTDDSKMYLRTNPSTTLGIWVSYMAISVGYDVNLSKYYKLANDVRKRFNFQFNCSRFTASLSYSNSTTDNTIKKIVYKDQKYPADINVPKMNSRALLFDAYYFLNHHKYSFAAAYSFGRIQRKSAGSFFFGFSYLNQRYDFDFSTLPPDILHILPDNWENNTYKVRSKEYGIKAGYAYNWVFSKHWLLAISESPTLGITRGYINSNFKKSTSLGFSNDLRLSVVWNNGHFFAGAIGHIWSTLIYDKVHTLVTNVVNLEISAGYRFNLW